MNELDVDMMLALNFDGGTFLDSFMWFCSRIWVWIPLYAVILFLIYRRFGWKYMLVAMLFMGLGVGICDQVCNFFKSAIPYLRPTRDPAVAPFLHTVRGYRGGMYGTVSGHASTSFSIFVFSSFMLRPKWFIGVTLLYTLLISYSRIYLGVHFPMQILFGIILGAAVAILLWFLFKWINGKYGLAVTPVRRKKICGPENND